MDVLYFLILAFITGFIIWRQDLRVRDLTNKLLARNAAELIGLDQSAEMVTHRRSDEVEAQMY